MSVHLTPGRNVLGGALKACSYDPVTGYFRDGCCRTRPDDTGLHVVCARMTDEFLAFSFSRGNNLVTPRPEWRFAGLLAGQRWCLCAERWLEAWRAGKAPPVVLESTHEKALELISLEVLQAFAWQPIKPADH
jgi:uncharacterized protein (DUF2237 family)